MKPISKGVLGLLCAFLFSLTPCYLSAGSIGGTYTVEGMNPGGKGEYKGTVTITQQGSIYRLQWNVGNTFSGIGIVQDNVLAVTWVGGAGAGVVAYTIKSDGSLEGVWASSKDTELGKERLKPQSI